MKNQTLRQRLENLFGFPAMKMPWSLYLAQLNEAGKITGKSMLDILTVILESAEQTEQEIRDIKLMTTPTAKEPELKVDITPPPIPNKEKLPPELDPDTPSNSV